MHNDSEQNDPIVDITVLGATLSLNEVEIERCVTPFVATLNESFDSSQLTTEPSYVEPLSYGIDVIDQLGRQLPDIFSVEALKKYLDHQEMIRTMAHGAFNRAINQVERDRRENG